MRVACVYFLESTELEKVAEACLRFSPQIAIGKSAIFIEIGGCRKLYSEKNLMLRLQILLKRFKVHGRIAIANDIPTSYAMAVFRKNTVESIPVEALQFYASPFTASDSMAKVITSVKRLGIHSLKELSVLPRKSLASRFGKEALMAFHYLERAHEVLWPRFNPSEIIFESADIAEDFGLRELEPLVFMLRPLIDKTLLRLRGQAKLAAIVEVRIQTENYSSVQSPVRNFRIELAFPQGTVACLLPIIRERLESRLQREPLEAHATRIEFEVIKAVYGQARQKDFFSKKEEDQENIKSVISRLTDRLGFDKVFHANPKESYFPERSWLKTLSEPEDLKPQVPKRPSRLLKSPQPLKKIDNYFVHKNHKWKILNISEPERLSGDWWLKDQGRDYFRIKTESGDELWVYLIAESQEYFLHGIYD